MNQAFEQNYTSDATETSSRQTSSQFLAILRRGPTFSADMEEYCAELARLNCGEPRPGEFPCGPVRPSVEEALRDAQQVIVDADTAKIYCLQPGDKPVLFDTSGSEVYAEDDGDDGDGQATQLALCPQGGPLAKAPPEKRRKITPSATSQANGTPLRTPDGTPGGWRDEAAQCMQQMMKFVIKHERMPRRRGQG